jgi:hypothetical protein
MSTVSAKLSGLGVWRGSGSLLLLVVLTLSSIFPAFADDSGWVLTQKSAQFGDQYLYVTKNGLKCYNPRAGFAFVSHAPDWNVIFYNEKTRVYYQTTMDKWKAEMRSRGFGTDMQDRNWTKGGSSNICGLHAVEHKMTVSNTLRLGKRATTQISGATYWTCEDISVPPQLSSLLSTVYGLPTTQYIPLRVLAVEQGKNKQLLDTYRSQQSAIPVSYFSCPSGLTPVKSDAEVMMNDEQKQILNDMARDLDDPKSSKSASAQTSAAPLRQTPVATASGATASSGKTINVGGVSLDKDKVQKFLDAFQKKN